MKFEGCQRHGLRQRKQKKKDSDRDTDWSGIDIYRDRDLREQRKTVSKVLHGQGFRLLQ